MHGVRRQQADRHVNVVEKAYRVVLIDVEFNLDDYSQFPSMSVTVNIARIELMYLFARQCLQDEALLLSAAVRPRQKTRRSAP